MAKKTGRKTATKKSEKAGTSGSKPPEGYKSIRSGKADGFFVYDDGAVFHGVLLGRFMAQGGKFGPRAYYHFKSLERMRVQVKDGDDYEMKSVPAGSIVSVDEKGGIRALATYVDSEQVVKVWFKVIERLDPDDDRSAWKIDGPYVELVSPEEAKAAGDDVPF